MNYYDFKVWCRVYTVDCRVCFWHCSLFFRFLNLFIQSNANSRELVLRTLASTQIHSDKYAMWHHQASCRQARV